MTKHYTTRKIWIKKLLIVDTIRKDIVIEMVKLEISCIFGVNTVWFKKWAVVFFLAIILLRYKKCPLFFASSVRSTPSVH